MRGPPLESEYSNVGPPEGRVAEGVAEGVDGGVDVAEAVGDLPHQLGDDPVTLLGAQDPLYSSYFYNTLSQKKKTRQRNGKFFQETRNDSVSEQKEQNLDHESKILCCRSMSFLHHSQHVVGGPGQDEHQQDGGQRLGRLALLTNQR